LVAETMPTTSGRLGVGYRVCFLLKTKMAALKLLQNGTTVRAWDDPVAASFFYLLASAFLWPIRLGFFQNIVTHKGH
jgi:hypothetical protein